MTWRGGQGDWADRLLPQNECNLGHLVDGLTGSDAPTGPFSIIMASLIRYARMQRVVELGVYKGGTTVFLADACRDTGGMVIAIDQDPCHEARDRLQRLGLASPHCHFHQGRTAEVPYDGVPIDLLFIDAGHSYGEMDMDWWRWSAFVKRGGLVFVDNTTSEAGVVKWLIESTSIPDFRRIWSAIQIVESFGVTMFQRML